MRAHANIGRPLLQVSDLRISLLNRGEHIAAVSGLSYELLPGRVLALIGESGSGKTTACRCLMGLLPPTAKVSGSVRLDGQELLGLSEPQMRKFRGAGIAMIFQDPRRSLNPSLRVGFQIAEVLRLREGLSREEAKYRAIDLLDMLRVPAPERRFFAYPHELSGGTCQRVMIAIAIAGNPRLLIADEATRSLDAITQAETVRLLRSLQQRLGMAVILVSHDLRLAASFADDVVVMRAGYPVEQAPTGELFRRPKMQYTRALLEAAR